MLTALLKVHNWRRVILQYEYDIPLVEPSNVEDDGCKFFFGNNNGMHKDIEVWCHIDLIEV